MTIWGIDVSHHQGSIDWAQVKQSGCSFAFIKATEGATFIDKLFQHNHQCAKENGLLVGAYHFLRSSSTIEAQLENFRNVTAGCYPGDLPPALDIELPKQWSELKASECVDLAMQFLQGIEELLAPLASKTAGKPLPFIYLSPNFADQILKNDPRLERYPLWLAHYTTAAQPRTPQPWSEWKFWQHSNEGRVSGIAGNVDLNRFSGNQEELRSLCVPQI